MSDTDKRRRARRDTLPLPVGVGGVAPFPPSGSVIAFRVLGRGIEIALDPKQRGWQVGREGPPINDISLPFDSVSRVHASFTRHDTWIEVVDLGSKNGIASQQTRRNWGDFQSDESVLVHAGRVVRIGAERLMALDAVAAGLIPAISAFCWHGAHDRVDEGLAAIAWNDVLVVPAHRRAEAIELARALHRDTARRDYPFLIEEEPPTDDAAIDALCTASGCGTLVLDLSTSLAAIADRLARNVFAEDGYHLRTFVIVDAFGGFDRSCLALCRYQQHRQLSFLGFPDGYRG